MLLFSLFPWEAGVKLLTGPLRHATHITPPIVAKITQDDSKTVERYRTYLKLLAHTQVDSWLGQQVDASDLVQQTLLDAVARCDQFRGESEAEFLAWLRRILSNNLVDARRYHGREKRDVGRIQSLEAEISTSFRRLDALADSGRSTPSQRAVTNEQLSRLLSALETLPGAQREAVILHHLQGLKLSETSDRLGRSEAAVCGLLHRGLKRLHELLEA